MFIAHLPAGLLITPVLQRHFSTRKWLWAGLLGSVLPDVDLVYFYTLGGRAHSHHTYVTHLPIFWLGLLAAWFLCARKHPWFAPGVFLLVNALVHLVLDSVVGRVMWLFPADRTLYALFEVPAGQPWWVMNFVLHWTFGFELLILGCAVVAFRRHGHQAEGSTLPSGSSSAR